MKKRLIKELLIVATCSVFAISQLTAGQTQRRGARRTSAAAAPAAAQQIPPVSLCSILPCAVPLPSAPHTPAEARPFFDWFSWESFIALNWPALVTGSTVARGQADTSKTIGDLSEPRVWESWKAEWELFRPASTTNPNVPGTPSAWASFNLDPNVLPCANANIGFLQSGGKLLVMSTKMDNNLNQINEALAGPLIAQNCTYVRYEIRVNEPEYDFIINPPPPNPAGKPFYIKANLPLSGTTNYPVNFTSSTTSTPFPLSSCQPTANPCTYGAIEVKAAWREMKPGEDTSRYYTVNALLVETSSATASCRQATMGLVGFHIGHKVSPFREWVWSTFEHVDNVPPDTGFTPNTGTPPANCSGAPAPFSFNNGYTTPPTTNGYNYEPPIVKPPLSPNPTPPVQVVRNVPINYANQASPTTQDINAMFQSALSGTVWKNYELVVTQWPRTDGHFQPFPSGLSGYPTTCDLPIPTDKTFSGIPAGEPIIAVANTTMETYYQATSMGIASCMHCHYLASGQDFSFMLNKEAFVPPSQVALLRARQRSATSQDPVAVLRRFLQKERTTHAAKQNQLLRQLKLTRSRAKKPKK
ncbi:MAG TPA: hypothetical protein VKA60_15785 [Blastocatellia bacterium]|nr:hypothetical protein [Blastocatellia bacterium]